MNKVIKPADHKKKEKHFLATSAVPFSASHLQILQNGPSEDP